MGHTKQFRLLVDTGSHVSLITEAAAKVLNFKRRKSNIRIHTIGNDEPITPRG